MGPLDHADQEAVNLLASSNTFAVSRGGYIYLRVGTSGNNNAVSATMNGKEIFFTGYSSGCGCYNVLGAVLQVRKDDVIDVIGTSLVYS